MLSANSTATLKDLFLTLAENGTESIVEVLDTDKYRNRNVAAGAVKVRELAKECGLNYEIPIWNPNYNGIDDYFIAVKKYYEEDSKKIKKEPILQERMQHYRIYQLDIWEGNPVRSYAFDNIEKLYESGLTEPPPLLVLMKSFIKDLCQVLMKVICMAFLLQSALGVMSV